MERLKVLTLNIWNRLGPFEKRIPLIEKGLIALSPDIVGLQEILHHDDAGEDQAQSIARAAGYEHVAFGAAWHIGGGLHLGNAVLSRWPIALRDNWLLPTPDGDETRALLYAEIDAPFGRVPLFVTHLAWRLHQGAVRVAQVEFIAARVAERASKSKYPAVLLGDFNAEPDADEIRYLRGLHVVNGRSVFFNDCHVFAGDGGPGYTFARRNPFARLAREHDRRIDYVFVRGPDRELRGEPLACRLALDEPGADGTFPSDHFGVYAELSITPAKL